MSEEVSGSELVEIEGVIEDEVGEPRNDGSPGSGLYEVPIRLSARPSNTWERLFVARGTARPSSQQCTGPGSPRSSGTRERVSVAVHRRHD